MHLSSALVVVLPVCLLLTGCSSGGSSAKYTPEEPVAESAVATALDAWKQGVPVGPVPETSPVIHLTDSYRKEGEALVEYEILGEVPGDVARCYAVNLTFDPPREEQAKFVVVGIDPLWVWRLEDYQLLTHWDHYMSPSETAAENEESP